MGVLSGERVLFVGSAAVLLATIAVSTQIILPVIVQMILYSFPAIYIGSHLALRQLEIDPVTGQRLNQSDSMNRKDALLFPVFGSAALLIMYLAYKFLDRYYVNLLLSTYLSGIGTVALAESIHCFTKPLFGSNLEKIAISWRIHKWPFGSEKEPLNIEASQEHLLAYFFASVIALAWMLTKNWVLHNIFATCFCIQAIAMVAIGDFKVGAILLTGLFVYDIFWVFGTDVMVTVAMSFEGPAKLIFPVSFDPWKQSILGLGDIVVPGVFIALCLKMDVAMHEAQLLKESKKTEGTVATKPFSKGLNEVDIHQKFGKFYFWVVIISYELGLLNTGIVLHLFQHPQPALLYLVPYCLISVLGAATLNGQVKEVLSYKNEETPPLKNESETDVSSTPMPSEKEPSDDIRDRS